MQEYLDKKRINAAFNRAAVTYNENSALQKEIANRLLESLPLTPIKPSIILDCGARSGYSTQCLSRLYPDAKVISVDTAEQLLRTGPAKNWQLPNPITAEPEYLPIARQSVDLLVSNLLLHWVTDIKQCIRDWRGVIKPGGILLFTMMGPDTLAELRQSFGSLDHHQHVHAFMDMHNIGDELLAAEWVDPVMSREHLTLTYPSVHTLLMELKATGTTNALTKRSRGLQGKAAWQNMLNHYQQLADHTGRIPASFEVIYGYAKAPDFLTTQEIQEVAIPVNTIKRRFL